MTTVTFREYVKGYRDITIEIPDLDLFKQKVVEHIESEESLNYWDCESFDINDDGSHVCTFTSTEVVVTDEDYNEFYEKMLELKVPTCEEEVEEFMAEVD